MLTAVPRYLVLVWLFAAAARAEATEFYGNWENPSRDAGGLSHVVISPAGGSFVSVRVYGDCHPSDCNWGLVQGKAYTADPRSEAATSIVAVVNFGFAHRQIIFRKPEGGRMPFEMLTDFSDGAGRHDFDMTGTLRQSAWAGPVSQGWEHPAAFNTGWGGGNRSGLSPEPRESCTGFDTTAVKTVEQGGSWKIVAGPEVLSDGGADRQLAMRALGAIRHYRFDQRCRVGDAPDLYWKSGRTFPRAKMGGDDCTLFNPTTVHVVEIGHRWKVVDGVKWLTEPGGSKAEADAVLSLIRFHHLNAECVIGRPHALLTYWAAF